MLIGVPREIKKQEYRVGLTPASVRELVHHGHQVVVERDAGRGIGTSDGDYEASGAAIAPSAEEVWDRAEMIVKVKEPQPVERKQLRAGQVLFTYLHLAPDREQTADLVKSGAICIAYETVTAPGGGLPLLAPMSEVAGRMAIQVGATFLEEPRGGLGILLSGVPGVAPGKVVIIGGGTVGANAAYVAAGIGADVVVLDRSLNVLRRLVAEFGPRIKTEFSTQEALERHVTRADLVVGGVLIPGGAAPKLVTREMVRRMKKGAVMVDVAIDQGGCFETSRPTTHADPVFQVDGVIHYCVANMPGAVPRTSAFALNNATLPFVLELAGQGWRHALLADPHLRNGLNVCAGKITCEAVAAAQGLDYHEPLSLLRATFAT